MERLQPGCKVELWQVPNDYCRGHRLPATVESVMPSEDGDCTEFTTDISVVDTFGNHSDVFFSDDEGTEWRFSEREQ